ncbi:hypothetical protein ACFFWC_02870 [Plantactinospora siamensis]|uniref:Uncharacterized protein n=1 Tax=Plantactinospora siamensis TaxID=555372 RepID=A0ABV6NQB3_9ACTN
MLRTHTSESKRSMPLRRVVLPACVGRGLDDRWNPQTLGRWRG